MLAFCLLLLPSYYATNFAGKIDASLARGHTKGKPVLGAPPIIHTYIHTQNIRTYAHIYMHTSKIQKQE